MSVFLSKHLNLRNIQLLTLLVLVIAFLSYRGSDRLSVLSFRTLPPPIKELPFNLPTPHPYPTRVNEIPPPPLTSQAAVVVDVSTAATLFTQNPDTRLKQASTTKIMTALVALQRCPLDKVAKVRTLDLGQTNTQMGLTFDEQITVEALLYGLLLNSGNDAALALAENCAADVSSFVRLMNEKARELNLSDTNFANPSGIDNPAHYSSVSDLAKLTAVAMRNPEFAKIVATKDITVSNIAKTKWHTLKNKNLLLGSMPNVIGVKTGWTEASGECLVTALKHGDNIIVSVVLGSKDRFGESKALLEWTVANYSWPAESS